MNSFQKMSRFKDLDKPNYWGETKLISACGCFYKNLRYVKFLVSHGANVNAKENNGNTSLMLACNYKRPLNLIQYLVSKGANLNDANDYEQTPLLFAVRSKRWKVVEFLIHSGAKHKTEYASGFYYNSTEYRELYGQFSLLSFVIVAGAPLKTIKTIIKYGSENIDESEKTVDDNTPLICAMKAQRFDVASLLIESGADVNIENKKGITAFSYTFFSGEEDNIEKYRDIRQKMIEYGVDINGLLPHFINDGTILHWCICRKSIQKIEYLLSIGANSFACNRHGTDCLQYAYHLGNTKIIDLILNYRLGHSEETSNKRQRTY